MKIWLTKYSIPWNRILVTSVESKQKVVESISFSMPVDQPLNLADRIDALNYRGVYGNVAAWKGPFTIPFYPFLMKEIRILGSSKWLPP